MRNALFLILVCHLTVLALNAQISSEEAFQSAKALAIQLRDTNLDSSIAILHSALLTFDDPYQKMELLNDLGRTYELTRQLDSSRIILEEAQSLAEQFNREDLLVSILYNLSYAYYGLGNFQIAVNQLRQSYRLAGRLRDDEAQFNALNQIGRFYSYIGQSDSAELYMYKGLDKLKQIGDKNKQARTLMNLGNNAARSNQIPKAMDYYNQSLVLANDLADFHLVIAIYGNIGYTYTDNGKFPLALEAYQKAMQIAEQLKAFDRQAGISQEIGSIYISLNDLNQAIEYYEQAERLWAKEKNANQRKYAIEKKGDVYLLKKDYALALDQFLQSDQMVKLNNKNLIEAPILLKIGSCYEKLSRLDSARFYYEFALNNTLNNTVANDIEHQKIIGESLSSLARIYLEQGELDSAYFNARQAFEISRDIERDELSMEAAALLYQIYKIKGNSDRALQYHEFYRNVQDSIFNQQNSMQIAQLEIQNRFDREKQELAFEREKERQAARNRQLFTLIITGSLALFLFITYRNVLAKKRSNTQLSLLNNQLARQNIIVEGQKKKLEELDQVKSRFFTNISHELRTPLTVIGGMARQIKGNEKAKKLIQRNNHNLLELVNQILDLRKLESGVLQLELIQGNIIFYLRYILESFHSLAQSKGLVLHFLSDETAFWMDYDKEKLLRIVSNLLSNAIKFTPENGHVYLSVDSGREIVDSEMADGESSPIASLMIAVKDTGIGIPENKLPYIFDRYYQVDDSATRKGEGAGIGLALTKELAKLMNGRIEVQSEEGKGSTFRLILPVARNASLEKNEAQNLPGKISDGVVNDNNPEYVASATTSDEKEVVQTPVANKKPTLLIIEDNPDLVEYLESLLSHHYDLEIATDGQEGIEIALEQIPDLILSDVMMPRKDGFEVCETLKNDQRTSHIPIVLLTAKADAASRVAGLKRGADAYLAKPFNQEELFVHLEKLHRLRLQLQARYSLLKPPPSSEEASLDASDDSLSLTQAEDAFMQSLREIVETNLDNEKFAVPELCRAIGMSRSQLHRKIKALANRSTTHYIRSIRLQKAKELLQEGDLNVTQVAFEVGFQNRTYFSRAFSDEFGVSPKDISAQ